MGTVADPDHDLGVKRFVLQIVYQDVLERSAHRLHEVNEKVVRERPRNRHALHFHRDGFGFGGANPNQQEKLGSQLLEDHHPLIVHLADPDAVDYQFTHLAPSLQSTLPGWCGRIAPKRVSNQQARRIVHPPESPMSSMKRAHPRAGRRKAKGRVFSRPGCHLILADCLAEASVVGSLPIIALVGREIMRRRDARTRAGGQGRTREHVDAFAH